MKKITLLLLAIILFSATTNLYPTSKVNINESNLRAIALLGLTRFEIENDRFPTTEEGLMALRVKPDTCPNWHGPYLETDPIDSWGRPYRYRCPGTGGKDFDLWSVGMDGIDGTKDDLIWPHKLKFTLKKEPESLITTRIIVVGLIIIVAIILIVILITIKKTKSRAALK